MAVDGCFGQGTGSKVITLAFHPVGEVLKIGGGDGHVLGGDLEHVEVLAGNACEHSDENADQTGDRQAKWHCDADKSSGTHFDCGLFDDVVRLCIDGVDNKRV